MKGPDGIYNAARIGGIQRSLQRQFPKTYKKGQDLTSIHRHIKALKQKDLVLPITTRKGETWYLLDREKYMQNKILESNAALWWIEDQQLRIKRFDEGLREYGDDFLVSRRTKRPFMGK